MKESILLSILLPLTVVSLSGCVKYNGRNKDGSPKDGTSSTTAPTSGSSEDTSSTSAPIPPAPQGQTNLYLVLGPTGSYTGKAASPEAATKFLDNTVIVTVDRGSALPDGSVIISSVNGSSFLHWVDRDTTEVVTTAPDKEESILVAVFQGGGGGNTPTPTDKLPTSGFGFLFSDNTRYALAVKCTGNDEYDLHGREQYKIADMDFQKDEQFCLFNFEKRESWTIDLDPTALGNNPDEYLIISGGYYKVLKSFRATNIYLKLRYEDDQLYMELKR